MAVYYNEIEPFAVRWLRNLILAGHLPDGEVDDRDIRDVCPDDLEGFDHCHFFAGIGGWPLALRMVGWPDDRPVWTGSCPCQPFSSAGKGGGAADERHLWPAFFHLIDQRRPPIVFGEQVASKAGLAWLDLVQADLEGAAYGVGAVDLCAAGIGAPHIRQRLWFVADADGDRCGQLAQPDGEPLARGEEGERRDDVARRGDAGGVGNPDCEHAGRDARTGAGAEGRSSLRAERDVPVASSDALLVGDTLGQGSQERPLEAFERGTLRVEGAALGAASPLRGFWSGADWLYCRDGKYRPVEPGAQPLAHGIPNRVGQLRAYGNAIVPQVAAEVMAAFMECRP